MDYAEINTIRQQFLSGQWPQMLQSVSIDGLRGWAGEAVNFRFPIVAIVGENGSGKSTVLKVAASAYGNTDESKRFRPSDFFVSTHWDQIQGVKLNYQALRGTQLLNYSINKPSERWRESANKPPVRNVFFLEISRTLPLDASVGYAAIARKTASVITEDVVTDPYRLRLSHVLGREYLAARFDTSNVDAKRPVGLLTREWGQVSGFHQGAGEDTTLDLVRMLQGIPNNSLLIIDEVEASLHPKAQRRLMRFLLWFSRQKRVQVIVSTHSPYILEEIPEEARIMLLRSGAIVNVIYGISPEFAMSRLDDEIHPELFVHVEDREAASWMREILASSLTTSPFLQRIQIDAVGASNVVKTMHTLAVGNKLPYKGLAVLDGDNRVDGIACLPGTLAPERQIFADLKNQDWADLTARFGIGAGTLFTALDDAMLEPDHHRWTALIGDRVHKSSSSVWDILVSSWCAHCLLAVDREALRDAIVAKIGENPPGI
ncbi:MAG: ATP-dependent nuclease [Janthinobacterium lividum]